MNCFTDVPEEDEESVDNPPIWKGGPSLSFNQDEEVIVPEDHGKNLDQRKTLVKAVVASAFGKFSELDL